eukprot:s470_g23.t1
MSRDYGHDDVVDITLRFGNLSVSVSGPSSQASQLVSEITSASSVLGSSRGYSERGSPARSSGPSEFSQVGETRVEIEASFPDCPQRLFDSASSLGRGIADGRRRIQRAWTAGHWARAVLRGQTMSVDMQELEMTNLVALTQERREYVLEWRSADEEDGQVEVRAFVVMKRPGGFLLAVPLGALPDEDLESGTGQVGPSTVLSVPGALFEEGREVPIGADLNVLLVDMDASAVSNLRPAQESDVVAIGFVEDDPFAVPSPDALLARALAWVQEQQEVSEQEMGWYTPEATATEEDTRPLPGRPRRNTGRGKATPSGTGHSPKAKRPTAASLHVSMQQVLQTLPGLSSQMQQLMDRQTMLETQIVQGGNTARALAQPLAAPSTLMTAELGSVAKSLPVPPKTASKALSAAALPLGQPLELQELEVEKGSSSELAQAMLAQSTAITTLVAQLASSGQDPMSDLQIAAPSGSKGAAGRAKLQSELALHKGLFFDAVVKSMARRMAPTASADRGHLELLAAGVSGTRYLERFGGYGRQKELGIIQHQTMMALDFLMSDNVGAAKDCIALLAVMLEQACLDNGRFELAQILTMQEDVPASVFSNRQLAQSSRAKAFAPLADQRWITTSIAFLKELDTISTRRTELLSGQSLGSSAGSGGSEIPKSKGKRFSKEERKRKGKSDCSSRRRGCLEDRAVGLLDETMTFQQWAMSLPRRVIASRTEFGRRLAASFSVKWCSRSTSTAAFPLPVPFPGCFSGSGPKLSLRRLRILAQKRVVHTAVVVLNYLYLGRFASFEELGRHPSDLQRKCLRRLYAFVAACGSRPDQFPIPPGRSGPQLVASIDSLERFLEETNIAGFGYDTLLKPSASSKKFEEETRESHPELRPFRSLDAGRLKISGRGEWPIEDYLEGPFWLPFVEPAVLLHGADVSRFPVPNFKYESREEYQKLAKVWDDLGVLQLARCPIEDGHFCKVFNVYKSSEHDRQIGDRRIPNSKECRLPGPSRNLPPGPLLLGLSAKRGREKIRGSLTDRKDFYHQIQVNQERAKTNMVPFSYAEEEFSGFRALEVLRESEAAVPAKKSRINDGDRLGGVWRRPLLCGSEGAVFPCFKALFQGDHLGVEFALEGHQNLLKREGLLRKDQRLQGHHPLPLTPTWEALIIDDYFVIGAADRFQPKEESDVFRHLVQARLAYEKHCLPGSVEKDVVAEDLFKAAGAEIDSRDEVLSQGLLLVGAPLSKRLGLSLLTLRVAALDGISTHLASRLAGSWVSVLLFRRCLSSIVTEFFSVGAKGSVGEGNMILPLKRSVASELAMLSSVAPLICSDVSAPFLDEVFATDASIRKGAIVKRRIDEELAKVLWLDGDRRGHYTRLQNPFGAILSELGEENENLREDGIFATPFADVSPERPPLFEFDFVEVCGGVGKVSACMKKLGYVVAPVLDLSMSDKYDLRDLRLLEWIVYMLQSKLFKSMMLEPPCTTFSPAAYPAVRSYAEPAGWDRLLPKVFFGNQLAFRCLLLVYVCLTCEIPAGLEQPRLSKMAWLAAWRWLISLGCEEAVVASCMFGSVHRKEFRLLVHMLDSKAMTVKCGGGHSHIRIQGKYTKDSAIYTDAVAQHFAFGFSSALRRFSEREDDEKISRGSESVLTNDVLRTGRWSLVREWFWKKHSHINVLESSAYASLLKESIEVRPGTRFSVLLDSSVTKGAISKGRSSSYSLQPILRRGAACQIVGNLYPFTSFAPTKLNVADDPTRDEEIRLPSKVALWDSVPLSLLRELHRHGLPRPTANWVRLALLLSFPETSDAFAPLPAFQTQAVGFGFSAFLVAFGIGLLASVVTFGFGILVRHILFTAWTFSTWTWTFRCGSSVAESKSPKNGPPFRASLHSLFRFRCGFAMAICFLSIRGAVAPMVPETSAETMRAQLRSRIELASDRVLRKQTRENRSKLVEQFRVWLLNEHGVSWDEIFGRKSLDPEEISFWLASYGRDLHSAGKSYTRYSETINAVVGLRPILKRQVTAAWDLAFAWLIDEPHQHHPALPLSVMLAVIGTALMWGWPVEAALIALTWAGILRIGEVLGAKRGDLILPTDSAPGVEYILLRVPEPKTRGRGARHQSARVDPIDMVMLISGVFGKYAADQKLWPFSAATLRRRFGQLLSALGLPSKVVNGVRPYDLGSLRPGGATWLLNKTEDSTLVQRRGRWMSFRVMTIYLQEIAVATALPKMTVEETKEDEIRAKRMKADRAAANAAKEAETLYADMPDPNTAATEAAAAARGPQVLSMPSSISLIVAEHKIALRNKWAEEKRKVIKLIVKGGTKSSRSTGNHREGLNSAGSSGSCDKCDGKHLTKKKDRKKNKDAWVNYGCKNNPHQMGGDGGGRVLENATVIPQPRDGSGLYHALSYGLWTDASTLRRDLARFRKENPKLKIAGDTLEEWVRRDSNKSLNQYAQKQSVSGWGGGIELACCSLLKQVDIHVYENMGRSSAEFKRISCFRHPNADRAIHVLFQDGLHYDALQRKPKTLN